MNPEKPSCCSGGGGADAPEEKNRAVSLSDYGPLIVLVGFSLLAAMAKQLHYAGGWDTRTWMHDFMGFFLVGFAMLKAFDLSGFADGFQKYDLLAGPCRPYALLYPWIELALGLGYLGHVFPNIVYSVTIVVFAFGAVGVLIALRKGLDLQCACLGSTLKVPLTTVALTEDLAMAAMAGWMLF